MELPHLPRSLGRHRLRGLLPAPVLPGLHRALGQAEPLVPAVPADRAHHHLPDGAQPGPGGDGGAAALDTPQDHPAGGTPAPGPGGGIPS